MSNSIRNRGDALVTFFLLTFAISWGLAVPLMLVPAQFQTPLFVLTVTSPTIAATMLTFARDGWSGLGALYACLIQWRFGLQWYALLLAGIPLLGYLVSQVAGPQVDYDLSTPTLLFSLLFILLITGPLGEELGWRGFALPRLMKRFNPLVASLVLGAMWGVWHLPSFFLSGLPQDNLSIPVFLFMALCLSIVATWIFLHTGGSVLSALLFHYMVNFSTSILGAPLPAFTLVTAVAAVLIVVLDRRLGWFQRDRSWERAKTGMFVLQPLPRKGDSS